MLGVKIGFVIVVIILVITMYRTISEITDDFARGRLFSAITGVVLEVACLGIIVWGANWMLYV